jgi:hypothetical protein
VLRAPPTPAPIKVTMIAALAAFAWWHLGGLAQERLSNPRGYALVARPEPASGPAQAGLRRVFVVVIDGLGERYAAPLAALAAFRQSGARCQSETVPVPTVSMPVYATISTGLDAGRHGVRTNAPHAAILAESIWDVARQSGVRVSAVSELPWWRELFPRGFDAYAERPRAENFFTTALAAAPGDRELVLIHPLYVDEAGHEHGAASRAHADAVARVDAELAGFLDEVDPVHDLVIVTADHGHTARGGHGGPQPEVARVVTCVRPLAPSAPIPDHVGLARFIAEALGLRPPRHAVPADPSIVSAGRRAQFLRGGPALVILLLLLVASLGARSPRPKREAGPSRGAERSGRADAKRTPPPPGDAARPTPPKLAVLAWLFAAAAGHVALYVLVRGSFDGSSIKTRADWVPAAMLIGIGASVVAGLVHLALFRAPSRLGGDLLTLALTGAGLDLAHAAALGWPVGYPLPPVELLFWPFFAASFVVSHSAIAAICAISWLGAQKLGARRRLPG